MLEENSLFKSPYEWREFTDYIIKENRYVLNEEWQRFIQSILYTSKKREYILKAGRILARARIGINAVEAEDENGMPIYNEYPLPPKEMNAPPYEKATAGRLNPNGISYLYLASDEKTAIAEIRPWMQADISVGYFKVLNDQKLVDLTKDHQEWLLSNILDEKLTPKQLEESIWASINSTFSKPLSPHDLPLHYFPSQYLAEVFKMNGFDGIGYKSSLNKKGFNIVLFKTSCVKLRPFRQIFRVNEIEYKFSESGNSYSCKDKE